MQSTRALIHWPTELLTFNKLLLVLFYNYVNTSDNYQKVIKRIYEQSEQELTVAFFCRIKVISNVGKNLLAKSAPRRQSWIFLECLPNILDCTPNQVWTVACGTVNFISNYQINPRLRSGIKPCTTIHLSFNGHASYHSATAAPSIYFT